MKDVIVVGGGPTGFITALGLAQAGAEVLLIEAGDAVIDSPRAAVYHWSTLEGLERLGIREEAERTGFPKQDYLWLVRQTGERIAYDLSVLKNTTQFPYNIHLGQDRLAEIARDRLEALPNAEVRFGTRMERLAQDAGGVTLTTDRVEELRARWVVGADGAGSEVRHQLGLAFEGFTWPERFVATNVYHDFESADYGLSTMVIDDKWGAVIVKIARDGLWRCTYMEDASLPEDSFLDRVPAAYEHLLAGNGGYKLDRAAPYKMHQRCAETFRKGRVMLAGDAAHVTNPTGGFGLTTGLFDAFSLWPTLAAVVLDEADPMLLNRWADDRRRVYLERTSPQATAYKRFVFHANGGGVELEMALKGMRAMSRDPDVRLQRLMFTKGLETASPVEGALA
ncbi:FAD-dependent monooxygenase [Croceibacterium sp. LX-88]|uniref:FAD-dependent monooxygenase n=2 Tax=Croceibacterium selenioxidans TaxID=2838833 RepID=A0ABS5W6M1_9SPHN|nr:FAD-dependent monooxygenase [Croceibacterium selenioxidans]MBT2135392.1 FAD-dependent monooxygenase [Croceibacterium selenioxidans]